MGQKVNPVAFRLGINKVSSSNWYASKKDYALNLIKDQKIRKLIKSTFRTTPINEIRIERKAQNLKVTISTSRPGNIVGRKGESAERLSSKIASMRDEAANVRINIEEIRKPETNAKLVAQNIAQQLEKRIAFRRAMRRSIQNAMRMGVDGIKISLSGRLNGAEIARREVQREGSIPLHTIKANLDYATYRANTTFGVIGVKVWINRGEDTGS